MEYTLNGRTVRESAGTSSEAEARAILADRVRDLTIEQQSPYLFVRTGAHGGYFHRQKGRPLLTRTIFHVVSTKVSSVVGEPVHPHVFRHSFASRLRENGAPLELIQEALGHAQISTTLIYAGISSKKRREDVARYLEGGE